MHSEEEELSHFAHALGSPLTAIQGAARMLALLRPEASPDERRLLEIIERNCRRLSGEVERLLAAARVEGKALRVVLPLDRGAPPVGESPPGPEEEAPPTGEWAGRPLILVVDDDSAVREMLSHILGQAGYAVLSAADGASAVDLARRHRPALITLDLAMPGVDGRRLLPVFKEDPAIKDIPVLVISALASGGALNIPGAAGALSKPVHREVLLRAVEDILHPPPEAVARRGKILLVDDEEDTRRPLAIDLNERGYAVFELGEGSATLEAVRYWEPDLVLLDLRLPDADGMDILRALKEDWRTAQTAVILLSAEQRPEEKARAFRFLADDYVTKPYSIVELVARIEAVLRRREAEFSTSPSTRLPGNVAIERALRRRLASGEPLAVCYADLDHFKAYNDVYGFLKGDGVIHQTARVLVEAVRELGNPDDFVGHVGGDDFVVLTTPERAEAICRRVVEEFDQVIPLYYDAEARSRGYIETLDRQGRPARFPLMSITLVIVTNEQRTLQHPGQVADIAAELKRKAKTIPGSVVFRDRRADSNGPNAHLPVQRG
ncbi:MAG: response regulator [Chloroflexia bacterium]